MSSNITGWLYIMFVGWAQVEWTFVDLALFCGFPSICPSVTFYVNKAIFTKLSGAYSYHQKVKIIKQILTFVVRWIRDNIFQAKDVFTSHARWIRLLLEKYYHVFTSTKVNICILLFFGCNTVMSLVETRSRDKNILRYCHPKKCIPLCIDRAVNTPFYDVVFVFQSIRRWRHCRFNIGFDMEGKNWTFPISGLVGK